MQWAIAVESITRRSCSRTCRKDSSIEFCVWIFFGVFAVDAVHACGLHQDVGTQFEGFLRRSGIGRDKRRAGAAGENNDTPFFQVSFRAPADIGLGNACLLYTSDAADE